MALALAGDDDAATRWLYRRHLKEPASKSQKLRVKGIVDILRRAFIAMAAVLLERILGKPPHPLVGFGRSAEQMERRL